VNSSDRLERLLAEAIDGRAAAARDALAPLLAYDEQHGADLVPTLSTYLALGCNASRCAEHLFLHRSGLLYRLGRIEHLLGVRLDSYEVRVSLEIATLAIKTG
jgi:DNA-binding PucR family transcriptional regulator